MLKRCAACGKPVYVVPSSKRAECGYCYARGPADKLEPLYPCELDWRRPLLDAASTLPPCEETLRRFVQLGDYADAPQRRDLCEREMALRKLGSGARTADDGAHTASGGPEGSPANLPEALERIRERMSAARKALLHRKRG